MSDKTPPVNETPEEKERRLRREDMFSDLEEKPAKETLASLRAQRALLQGDNGRLTLSLVTAQNDKARLLGEVEEARASLRRAEAKAEQDKKFALEKFIKETLPVIDTLELGLSAIPADDRAADAKFDKLATGIEKTLVQLTAVFNKFGIREINPLGETFDENKHYALGTQPHDSAESDTIVAVKQKGYEIEGRVIRPAMVFVAP